MNRAIYLPFMMLLFALVLTAVSRAADFDETIVLSKQYQATTTIYNSLTPQEREQIREKTAAALDGISAIHPMPYVISPDEDLLIKKGARQISQAIRNFFEDHFTGKKSYQGKNVIPESILQNILSDYPLRSPLNQPIPMDSTAFIVGPDIVRTSEGFRLLEINVAGWMGGLSMMSRLNDEFLVAAPQYKKLFKGAPHASEFYQNLASHYQSELRPDTIGVIVSHDPSNEFAKAMKGRGFHVAHYVGLRMNHENDALWIETETGPKKVSFLHLDVEANSMSGYPWGQATLAAYLKGHVKLSTPPHGLIMMDKRFLPYIGSMIQFYLHETPVILPPRSEPLTAERFAQIRPEIEKYVIKMGEGRGGQAVYLGPGLAKDPIAQDMFQTMLDGNTKVTGIIQEMASIGQRDGMQGDFRPITYVDHRTTITTPVPWSRSSRVNEKSNVTGRHGSSTQNAVLVQVRLKCFAAHSRH